MTGSGYGVSFLEYFYFHGYFLYLGLFGAIIGSHSFDSYLSKKYFFHSIEAVNAFWKLSVTTNGLS